MKTSPRRIMFIVWTCAVLSWTILPFKMVDKSFSLLGIVLFSFYLLSFFFGYWFSSSKKFNTYSIISSIRCKKALSIIKIASLLSILLFLLSLGERNIFNLTESFEVRSKQADALLTGSESSSSLFFQLAFLLYPSGYVFSAIEIIYQKKIRYGRVIIYGLLPVILAMLVMGGRFPLLYYFSILFFSFKIRTNYSNILGHNILQSNGISRIKKMFISFCVSIVAAFSVYYFATVFFVRAEAIGGADLMFEFAEEVWGVSFDGYLSPFFLSTIGINGSFLLFIFSWYAIQGFVMTNIIFTSYTGPLQFGSYGIDIFSAVFRRLFGSYVSENFNYLLDIGTYGFLPSAFGSLFIDFGYYGLLICFFWGKWSSDVFKKATSGDVRSMLLMPFMISGIVFSVINTPLGFTNGFITFIWLYIVFYSFEPSKHTLLIK